MSNASTSIMLKRVALGFLISAISMTISNSTACRKSYEKNYFDLQSEVILASIARRFQQMSAFVPGINDSPDVWIHSLDNYEPFIAQELFEKYDVLLTWNSTQSRFEAIDKDGQEKLNVYEQKDQEKIASIVLDCNEWMRRRGRLACEFDGGSDYRAYPYTTFLLYTDYLAFQSDNLAFKDGRYRSISKDESAIKLTTDFLLSRNGVARVINYNLLFQTSFLLARDYEQRGEELSDSAWGWELPSYAVRRKYYLEKRTEWEKFLNGGLHTSIEWTNSGFEVKDTETGQRVAFPRDDDLLNEAVKELNYYKEKCDFVNYFQIENYPMFLLSILRLYDVNLELDKTTNKYVIAPGPTDPQKFFDSVSEFTFVDDPSDTEYLKQHLTSWLESP